MLKAESNSGNTFDWRRSTWSDRICSGDLKIQRAPQRPKVELKLVGIHIRGVSHSSSSRLGRSSRMLKKSASSVLGSSKSSTGTRPPHRLGGAHRCGAPYSSHRAPQRVRLRSSLTAALPVERCVLARWGWAGEKSSLFEHPALTNDPS